MKDNLQSYDFRDELISRVVPSPQYPTRVNPRLKEEGARLDAKANLERLRTAAITK